MTNFTRIQEINNQCMRNIEMIMHESKNIIKNFKIQQAEVMKNIMVTTDESSSLEQQFRNFQNELIQREQDQYNQINGRIANEIDNMKRLILQEMSSPSISMNTPSAMPTFNTPAAPINNTMDLNSFSTPVNTMGTTPDNNSMLSQTMPDMNTMSPMEQETSNSLLNEFDSFASPMQQSTPISNPVQTFGTQPTGAVNEGNDIPVETKELDEWISEIKNLI